MALIRPNMPPNMRAPGVCRSNEITLVSATAAAASGNLTYTNIVHVGNARYMTLAWHADPQAASNQLIFIPLGHTSGTQPASNDVDWRPLPSNDGSRTTITLAGTIPAPAGGWTATPKFEAVTFKKLAFLTDAATGASDELVGSTDLINISGYDWIQIAWGEYGVTGSPSTLDNLVCVLTY